MFTPKGLFSEVVCPYEKDCLLPRCLFAHPNKDGDENAAASVGVAAKVESNGVNSEDGQRKRRKIEVGPSTASPATRKEVSGVKQSSEKASVPSTTHREVSPPPLRRTTDSTSKATSQVKTIPSSQQKKPPSALSSKAVKTESLNPRMLSKSPASHDLRFKLLKALHEHLVRLNTELSSDASPSEELLILSDQQLITMALNLEEQTAREKPTIYSNVVKNHILAYKRMSVQEWKAQRQKEYDASVALQNLKEKESSNGFGAVPPTGPKPKPLDTGLTPAQELAILPQLYTPITAHEASHGYVIANPSASEIEAAKAGLEAAKGFEICDRCKSRFQVFPGRREEDGALASGGICTYHWGKPFWTDKLKGDPTSKRERKYRCCGENVGDTPGCTTAATHVFKVVDVKRLATVMEFVETPPSSPSPSSSSSKNHPPPEQPICIDGEMGYTTLGLELIRLTATSWPSGAEIFDLLVRPFGEILDLNTRWSGVTPEQMADALPFEPSSLSASASSTQSQHQDSSTKSSSGSSSSSSLKILPSPRAALAHLLSHIPSRSTPLIGHGLENDLNSLRLIHPTLIDTALLFPHKAGLPIRNGLKNLVWHHLGIRIQQQGGVLPVGGAGGEGGVELGEGGNAEGKDGKEGKDGRDKEVIGHDSKEDANAAGWLVRWKVGERWRVMQHEGWRFEDGNGDGHGEGGGGVRLVPPAPKGPAAASSSTSTSISASRPPSSITLPASATAVADVAKTTTTSSGNTSSSSKSLKRKSDLISKDNDDGDGDREVLVVEEGEVAE